VYSLKKIFLPVTGIARRSCYCLQRATQGYYPGSGNKLHQSKPYRRGKITKKSILSSAARENPSGSRVQTHEAKRGRDKKNQKKEPEVASKVSDQSHSKARQPSQNGIVFHKSHQAMGDLINAKN